MMIFGKSESTKHVKLHPSLEEVVKAEALASQALSVVLDESRTDLDGRETIMISDGQKRAPWQVSSIRTLFRGDAPAPEIPSEPPPAYLKLFYFVERHALFFCDAHGDKTDREFEVAYSQLRRRPDGKPVSQLHFFLWQVAAGLTGIFPLSAAEFEAIFSRLARSGRTFAIGPVSRNYITVLRQTGGGRH